MIVRLGSRLNGGLVHLGWPRSDRAAGLAGASALSIQRAGQQVMARACRNAPPPAGDG